MAASPWPPCNQCGRPAFVEYQGQRYLCVDCNLKYQQAEELIMARMERHHNVLMDQMDEISGIPSFGGRYPERRPVNVSRTFNTIRIDRSTIGVVNTGTIESLEVSLAGIRQGGDEAAANALREMVEGVAGDPDLPSDKKTEALQLLDSIAGEAARPTGQRRAAVAKAAWSALSEIVKVGAALTTLWLRLGPPILAAFGG